jgi:hypothetical protein
MTMPAANQVSDGETTLIRNTGAETLTVQKSDASALATITAGAAVMLYVTDNATAAGTWGIVTYGTGSSSADAVSLAGYGLTAIGSVLNSAYPVETQSSSWTVGEYDRAKSFIYTGGTGTVTLPDATTMANNFFFLLRNAGTGTLIIDPNGSQTIDDVATMSFNPGESAIIVCNSSEWYTVGYGRSMIYQFTQLTKDVSAAGSFTLSDEESANKLLTFTGNPGSSVTIVVPTIVSIYYVNSDITTSQSIVVKTAAGAGASLAQGQRAIVFCDGVDVLAAQTAAVSGAIELEDGTASSPSLKFATDTDTGGYNIAPGFGISVGGTAIVKVTSNGLEVTQGYLQVPRATTPSQIADGGIVWDSDSDLLTVGTGAARKTMVDTDTAQTLTNKTITPAVLTLPSGTGSTTEGVVQWNTSTDSLIVGTGGSTRTMVDTLDVIAIAQGGTGQTAQTAAFDALAPTTAKGDLIAYNGTDNIRVSVGTDGYYLKADSVQPSGLTWGEIAAAEVTLTNSVTLQNKTYTNTNRVTYAAEYDAGTMTSVGTKTIVWSNGQKQYFTIDGTGAFLTTIVFDWTGCGVGHYQLRIVVADSFAYTLSWSTGTPGGTAWLGNSSAPALYTGGASRSTVFNFFYGAAGFICGSGNKVGTF